MPKTTMIASLPFPDAIAGLACAPGGRLWLCSPAGLFCEQQGQFEAQRGLPFQSASAAATPGKAILAAGYPNRISISPDSGRSWFLSRCEPIAAPVTCFAASPAFQRDAVLLAGVDGDGILRSTDGGHSWQLANFGLRNFHILALACAPDWEAQDAPSGLRCAYEYAFAAAEEGVYCSPNGGRAWRSASDGLPAAATLSLAVSPDFKRLPASSDAPDAFRGAVFAGMDGFGLYRSLDGGQSWQPLANFPRDEIVNALFFTSQGILLAATGEQGILMSLDLGESWENGLPMDDSVLCLGERDGVILAGTAESGLVTFSIGAG